jgi:hypothetical protein
VQNAFGKKAREQMHATQLAGSTLKKGKIRSPKDFKENYEQAKHTSKQGWLGIPASAFRKACISACKLCGFKMTLAKLSVFVLADGFDRDSGDALVKITKGKPRYVEHMVRNSGQGRPVDLRARAMWDVGWEATVRVTYDSDQFTLQDVANLMMRVGRQVGIGEGRPDSPNSAGMGWGTFTTVR